MIYAPNVDPTYILPPPTSLARCMPHAACRNDRTRSIYQRVSAFNYCNVVILPSPGPAMTCNQIAGNKFRTFHNKKRRKKKHRATKNEGIEILGVFLKAVPQLPLDNTLCQPKERDIKRGRSQWGRDMNLSQVPIYVIAALGLLGLKTHFFMIATAIRTREETIV